MSYITSFNQSNKADWIVEFAGIDADTGDDIDFTGASVLFVIKDMSGCQWLSGSTTDGTITLPTTNVIKVHFTAAQMETLCPGLYRVGCVFNLNSETDQLVVGPLSVYDGIAKL